MATKDMVTRKKTLDARPQRDHIDLTVMSPRGLLWKGKVRSISSVNSQGSFDLLPQHAHFVTLIRNQPIAAARDEGEKQFSFKQAVIHLVDDVATVYGDIN